MISSTSVSLPVCSEPDNTYPYLVQEVNLAAFCTESRKLADVRVSWRVVPLAVNSKLKVVKDKRKH